MEFNITAPAEKLIIRLWESLEKSTIGIFKPWQIKRIAKSEAIAEQFKNLLSAQTESDIQDLKCGKKYFDIKSSKLLPIAEDTEVTSETMLISNEYVKILCKSQNVANAIKIAVEQLENEQEQTIMEEPINQDWLNEWSEHAGFVSDKDMQQLWGKTLAGEIKNPGSLSLRTMQFLRNLSKDEANLIHKYLSYSLNENIIILEINGYTDIMKFPLIDKIKLIELGIIVTDLTSNLRYDINLSNKWNEDYLFDFFEHYSLVLILLTKEEIKLQFQVLKTTTLGQELAKLGNYKGNEGFIDAIGKHVISLNDKIKPYKSKDFNHDKRNHTIFCNSLEEITNVH